VHAAESFRVATRALRANALRSILTALGIIIGVAAVIAVVSIVQGLQFMITRQLQGVGATYVMVLPKQDPNRGPGLVARQVRLTWDDGQALLEQVPGIRRMTPLVGGRLTLRYRDRSHEPQLVFGVNQNWPEVNNHTVEQGRFFSRLDVAARRKVVVVGQKVVEELRLGEDPIGRTIYVGNLPALVIGVMEKRGTTLGTDVDDLAFVPFDTALGLFGRSAGEQVQLRLQVASAEIVDQVKEEIRRVLRVRHRIAEGDPDDFDVVLQDEILKTVGTILGGVTAVVGGVVGIALLVGGIGIMNIMLVSVTERTREIGLRKAVGARRQDILVQFLIEAVVLSLLGGAIGLLLGYGIGAGVAAILPGIGRRRTCRSGPSRWRSGSPPSWGSSSGSIRRAKRRASIRSRRCATSSCKRRQRRRSARVVRPRFAELGDGAGGEVELRGVLEDELLDAVLVEEAARRGEARVEALDFAVGKAGGRDRGVGARRLADRLGRGDPETSRPRRHVAAAAHQQVEGASGREPFDQAARDGGPALAAEIVRQIPGEHQVVALLGARREQVAELLLPECGARGGLPEAGLDERGLEVEHANARPQAAEVLDVRGERRPEIEH
jgi:putative ABC transport system permease protein